LINAFRLWLDFVSIFLKHGTHRFSDELIASQECCYMAHRRN
jgi:hypothetical protein